MKNYNIGEFFNDLAKAWIDLSDDDKKEISNKIVGVKNGVRANATIDKIADSPNTNTLTKEQTKIIEVLRQNGCNPLYNKISNTMIEIATPYSND